MPPPGYRDPLRPRSRSPIRRQDPSSAAADGAAWSRHRPRSDPTGPGRTETHTSRVQGQVQEGLLQLAPPRTSSLTTSRSRQKAPVRAPTEAHALTTPPPTGQPLQTLQPTQCTEPLQVSFSDSSSEFSQGQESPPNIPTPDSDVADEGPPSPSEEYKSYSLLLLKIAKVMNLAVTQPLPTDDDKVFEDITQD